MGSYCLTEVPLSLTVGPFGQSWGPRLTAHACDLPKKGPHSLTGSPLGIPWGPLDLTGGTLKLTEGSLSLTGGPLSLTGASLT